MKSSIKIDRDYTIGTIENDLFGSFIEHMGRAVYGGIYEPSHKTAGKDGFRGDVLQLARALCVPVIRYPGGNFLSGYDWKNGIGKSRPRVLELAWGQTEPNLVGIHEFMGYADRIGSKVMMSVNLGTGTPKEAAELVEYCNHPSGSRWSDERIKNGKKEPFGIKKWCLGNEMDGDWQICHLTADEYGRKARETAKLMRWVDKSIELVACGSSGPTMPTYPEWDRKVLEHVYDVADYISLHRYYTYTPSRRIEDFLASYADLDRFIKTVATTADYVKASKRSQKVMKLSVDEWNVWHTAPVTNDFEVCNDTELDRWAVGARRVENNYDFADLLAFTGLICALINNADRAKMGCLAQLVNVIAPILTETGGRAIRQTIYYPYRLAIAYAHGTALKPVVKADMVDTDYGTVPTLNTAVCYDEEAKVYTVFAVNCDKADTTVDLGFAGHTCEMTKRSELKADLRAKNTFDNPDAVVPREVTPDKGAKDSFALGLGGYSFTLLQFKEI
jgi:alpha-N-arabinofuranosidase